MKFVWSKGVGSQREPNEDGHGNHQSKSHGGPEKHPHDTFWVEILVHGDHVVFSSGNFSWYSLVICPVKGKSLACMLLWNRVLIPFDLHLNNYQWYERKVLKPWKRNKVNESFADMFPQVGFASTIILINGHLLCIELGIQEILLQALFFFFSRPVCLSNF